MNSIAKSAIVLMIATIVAKILGFGRELVLASSYGASIYSDAYLTSTNIPILIFTIIGSTIGTVLIPMYYEISSELDEKRALKFINNILNIVIIICVLFGILGFIFTDKIVKLFAMGFDGETLQLTISFTRILLPGIIFTGLSHIMTAYLQIKNNFVIPGLITVPKNIIIIISIILSVKYGPYIMIGGTLLGTLIELLFQIPFALKNGYKYKLGISLNDRYIKKALRLIVPVLVGVAVNQLNLIVDRTLASTLVEGSISALNYASKLNGFIMALFITSVSVVIYPILSKLSAEDNKDKFTETIINSINSIILLIIPISIGAIVLSQPIVKILFERGEFDARATNMTTVALIMYSIGMLGVGLRDILGKIFYSIKDTKTPMINGIIAVIMNIILNIIFIKYLKIAGIAFSTSISSIICILLLFRSLKKKNGYFGQDRILKTTYKSIIAALIMGISTKYIYIFLNNILKGIILSEILSLSGSICIGFIIYVLLIILFKVDEVNIIQKKIRLKLKNVIKVA